MDKEKRYVAKRKIKAFLYGIPYLLCRIFPIKKNKIVLWTFEGTGGYGCSPRYIAEGLLKQKKEGKNSFELYWIVKDISKEFPKEIHKIKDTTWNRAFHMTTARFWIGNTRTFYGTRKRKGTTYIQTWHGSLSLKPIGKYRGNLFSKMAYLVSKADSDLIDHAISGSSYCTDMWREGLIYDGVIDQLGSPRCDVLVNNVAEKRMELRHEYNIPEEAKIIIYAPTFRGGSQGTKRAINENPITLDFDRVLEAFQKRFGGEWYMFLRLHPQLSVYCEGMSVKNQNSRLIDVTQRPDMNEIMAATDAIITDYSTCIFEGFLNGQMGFIYADDLDDYVKDRGSLMFELDEIPFSTASDNDALVSNILAFDEKEYAEKSKCFIEKNGIINDGHATERTVKLIGEI
ncbi:CDP-glycerol glycerophosphotransferase [Butyrivibrio sp. INlla18]|uniref:CDP-glycerol glycerophosphotransferase family protein n=1 Tax=Butyrivibrio sp. INlla18 TaxID=1520806 RepID=UPI00088BF7C9|nr:CDP-glycerol glycerophosphotransferase family protein [Butyrivibrio sp. INlla18]SDA41710.1 CDP-glycerol glycerophosphotransferase [Butyrivibrio sp. INlla18]